MTMSIPQKCLNEVSAVAVLHKQQIRIVKGPSLGVDSPRDEMLRNLDYMQAQIGRLSKMAHDMRVLLMKTE